MLTTKQLTMSTTTSFWSKFMAMAEILSQQRYEKYAHEGHTYVLDKLSLNGTLMFWRCDRRTGDCKGRIHTTTGADRAFVKMVTQHTCADTGNAARVGVQTAISAVRRRAVETMEIPSVITAEVTQHLPRAVKGQLHSTDAIRKVVQRIRRTTQIKMSSFSYEALLIISKWLLLYMITDQSFTFVLIIVNIICYDSFIVCIIGNKIVNKIWQYSFSCHNNNLII